MTVWRDGIRADMRDEDDEEPFGFNWAGIIADEDVTIVTSAWEVEAVTPAGADDLVIDASGTISGQTTSTPVSGGSAGAIYDLRNRITTNETPPRQWDRSFRIPTGTL